MIDQLTDSLIDLFIHSLRLTEDAIRVRGHDSDKLAGSQLLDCCVGFWDPRTSQDVVHFKSRLLVRAVVV